MTSNRQLLEACNNKGFGSGEDIQCPRLSGLEGDTDREVIGVEPTLVLESYGGEG
jgi:hypothetical protein